MYRIRNSNSRTQIKVHDDWVDIPNADASPQGEQEITGCRVSRLLKIAIRTKEDFDALIRNCMGLDDNPQHAAFIRKLGAKLTPASEIKRESEPQPFAVGDRVRVHRNVEEPFHAWGGVTHESVGTVTRVKSNGELYVDFPSYPTSSWKAWAPEMERVTE